jgi:hypothetical protein
MFMQKEKKKEEERRRKRGGRRKMWHTTNYCTLLPTKILSCCNDHI